MRYRIKHYDKDGNLTGKPKDVSPRASQVPGCVRKALQLDRVVEVELHMQNDTSTTYEEVEET